MMEALEQVDQVARQKSADDVTTLPCVPVKAVSASRFGQDAGDSTIRDQLDTLESQDKFLIDLRTDFK